MAEYLIHYDNQLFWRSEEDLYEPIAVPSAIRRLKEQPLPQLRLTDDIPSRPLLRFARAINKDREFMHSMCITVGRSGELLDVPDLDGVISRRWCRGPTQCLYTFIATGKDEDFKQHPAYDAVAYLSATGSSERLLRPLLRKMCDIAVPAALHSGTRAPLDRLIETCSAIPPLGKMEDECCEFASGNFDASEWLSALIDVDGDTVLGTSIGNAKLPGMLLAAWRTSLRLILSQWLASEYHEDFIADTYFRKNRTDRETHAGYTRWRGQQDR